MVRVPLCALSALALSACATAPEVAPGPDPTLQVLERAAADIQSSWALLAAVERAKNPQVRALDHVANEIVAAPKLATRVTLSLSGDAEDVLRAVAEAGNVDLQTLGRRPPTAIPIYIVAQEARIVDVLRDIEVQMGTQASLKIRNELDAEFVELVYPGYGE